MKVYIRLQSYPNPTEWNKWLAGACCHTSTMKCFATVQVPGAGAILLLPGLLKGLSEQVNIAQGWGRKDREGVEMG